MAKQPRFKIGTTFLIVTVVIFYVRHRDAIRAVLAPRQPAPSTPVSDPPVARPAK